MKVAVVLLNLGGPDSKEAIKPFLYNFFMDKNIIRAPLPVRWLLAKYISFSRTKGEAGSSYAELGNKSPLLENTQAQAKALEKELGEKFKCFVCMRYWHPMSEDVVKQVKAYNPDHIVLLPLYPQYSTTTTRSSFQTWANACEDVNLNVPTSRVCCYPADDGFVKASAKNIIESYHQALDETASKSLAPPRVLFSAHGLPEDIIRDGDPYQYQVEMSAEAIVRQINMPMLDWSICYQSRVGPKKWIGPSTEEALERAAKDNVPVIIYPHAFVSEHVETLVEIELEYRELAQELGVPYFLRVPTVSTSELFIKGLSNIVKIHMSHEGTFSNTGGPVCPQSCSECAMNFNSEQKRAA